MLPAALCSPLGQHRTPGPWSSASVLWTHRGDRPGWAQSLPASAFPSPSPGTSGLHGLHPRCWVPGPMGHRSGSGLLFFRERRPESEAAWHSGTAAHWAQGGSTRDSHCPAGAVFLTGMERSGPPRPLVALVLLWGRSCLRGRSGTAWTPRSWPQGQTQAPSEVDDWGSGDTALHHVPAEGNAPAARPRSALPELVFRRVSGPARRLPARRPGPTAPAVTGARRSGGSAREAAAAGPRWGTRRGRSTRTYFRELS